jgi:K(+)-stimulated pyrophosphate-energized sodium pump
MCRYFTKSCFYANDVTGVYDSGFLIFIVLLGKLICRNNNQLIAEMLGIYIAELTVSSYYGQFFKIMQVVHGTMLLLKQELLINGEMTYKGSVHTKQRLQVILQGIRFEDTSETIDVNVLIKLTCLIGLVSLFLQWRSHHNRKELLILLYDIG